MVRRKTPVPEPRNVDKETIYVVSISTLEKNKITNAIIFSTGTRKVQFYIMCSNMTQQNYKLQSNLSQ